MAARSGKRRRASDSQERYREAYLDQVGTQLIELSGLMAAPDEDTVLIASAELERLADTAETLGLGQLERACRAAANELPTGRRQESLRLVAQALRRTRGQPRLGPILVVAAHADTVELLAQIDACSETIRVFADVQAFTEALHVDEPTAVCLPMESIEAIRQLSEYERFPVLAHGPPLALEGLANALTNGAVGYVPRPLDAHTLTRQARLHDSSDKDSPEVFLLMDPGPERQQFASALEATGLLVVQSGAPSDLGAALDVGHADAILMGAEVNGVSSATMAAVARGHALRGHLPLMVVGKPKNPAGLRTAGIDDLIRANADPIHIAQRIRDRVGRFMRLPWSRHPSSRILSRLGCLEALDAALRSARRSPIAVSVAMLQVDGLHAIKPENTSRVAKMLRSFVANNATTQLRRDDIVGELLPGSYLCVLPHAQEAEARVRIDAFRNALAAETRTNVLLETLSWRIGVADIALGTRGVAHRAERDLA
jgi:GGDEF domain-containing protein